MNNEFVLTEMILLLGKLLILLILKTIKTNESLADQLAHNSHTSRPKIGDLIESSEIEIQQRESLKQQKDLITKMTDEIENLEQKQKEHCKKLKTYKSNEQFTQTNIEIIKNWQTKLEYSSLEYLVSLDQDTTNKQLFENCQKGCVDLLDEIYNNAKNVKKDLFSVTKRRQLIIFFLQSVCVMINYI